MENTKEIIEKIFKNQLGFIPGRNLPRTQIPQWDSLKHVQLLILIQKELRVSFSISEIDQLDSLEGICTLVQNKRTSSKS